MPSQTPCTLSSFFKNDGSTNSPSPAQKHRHTYRNYIGLRNISEIPSGKDITYKFSFDVFVRDPGLEPGVMKVFRSSYVFEDCLL